MNKFLIIGVVILVGIIGVVAFNMQSDSNDQEANTDQQTQTQETNDADMFRGSFAELMERNQPYTCTFASNVGGTSQTGTVYITGENMRGEFTMQMEATDEPTEMHALKKGDQLYTWSSGGAYGDFAYMMQYSEMNNQSSETAENAEKQQYFDADEEYEFDCDPWNVDTDRFNVPEDIEFQDLSAQMETMMQLQQDAATPPSAGVQQIDCSVCDVVPDGPQREQCLASLGC